jgi:hypothetical protein
MLGSPSRTIVFVCVNLAYTRLYVNVESITPDHHAVSRNDKLC